MSFLGRTETVANGIQTAFPVDFAFQSRAEVGVYVRPAGSFLLGTPKVVAVDFNWTSDGLITFIAGHVPGAGTTVVVRRETLDTDLDNTIQPGGSIKSSQLVQNDRQLLYLVQELKDGDTDLQSQATAIDTNLEERAKDAVGGIMRGSGSATVIYDDAADTLTVSAPQPFVINDGTPTAVWPFSVFTPEQFLGGQDPNAVADWGPIFKLMWAAVTAAGGGCVHFDGKRGPSNPYLVGNQVQGGNTPNGVMQFAPETIYPCEVTGVTGTCVVFGNGASIKAKNGYKFGSFNADGTPFATITTDGTKAACPYFSVFYVHDNSGNVYINTPELNGNIKNAVIGNEFGDTGRQIGMHGVLIGTGNTGQVRVFANSHHQGCDGGTVTADGALNTDQDIDLSGRFNNNGRQGVSMTGGSGITLGRFGGYQAHGNGKDLGANGMTYSSPAAGIDFEPEGGRYVARAKVFNPDIVDNVGVGLLATAGLVGELDVFGGRIVGTTSYSLWLDHDLCRFHGGTDIVGTVAHISGTFPGARASSFEDVNFSVDAADSPTGAVYVVNGLPMENVISANFRRCRLKSLVNIDQPGCGNNTNVVWEDCHFIGLPATNNFKPIGRFKGRCIFEETGTVPSGTLSNHFPFQLDAGDSETEWVWRTGGVSTTYPATCDLKTGKRVFYNSAVWDPANVAAGASITQALSMPGCVVGDIVEQLSFSLPLGGLILTGDVSAANTLLAVLFNPTGAGINLASGTLSGRVRKA